MLFNTHGMSQWSMTEFERINIIVFFWTSCSATGDSAGPLPCCVVKACDGQTKRLGNTAYCIKQQNKAWYLQLIDSSWPMGCVFKLCCCDSC